MTATPSHAVHLTDFDRGVLATTGAMLAVILVLFGRGDRVDLEVVNVSPPSGASRIATRARIEVELSELPVLPAPQPAYSSGGEPAAGGVLRLQPPAEGRLSVRGSRLVLEGLKLEPATQYVATLSGVASVRGRELSRSVVWDFTTRSPFVAYLSREPGQVQRLAVHEPPMSPLEPMPQPRFVSGPSQEVWDFGVAPDGSLLAYTVVAYGGASGIWLVDPIGGEPRLILDCPESQCSAPVWHPTATRILYERRESQVLTAPDGSLETLGIPGLPRLWWLDVATGATAAVFADSQRVGFGASLSADGRYLAYQNPDEGGIVLADLEGGDDGYVPSRAGAVAKWSPVAPVLAITDMRDFGGIYASRAYTASALAGTPFELSPDASWEEHVPAWHPGGGRLALARAPIQGEDRLAHLAVVDATSPEGVRLTPDESVHYLSLSWSPDGSRLLAERLPRMVGGSTEIWLLPLGFDPVRIAEGRSPVWVP